MNVKKMMEYMPRKEDMSEENKSEWKQTWFDVEESRDHLGLFTSSRDL